MMRDMHAALTVVAGHKPAWRPFTVHKKHVTPQGSHHVVGDMAHPVSIAQYSAVTVDPGRAWT